jgi:hypothetical protein
LLQVVAVVVDPVMAVPAAVLVDYLQQLVTQ